MFHRLLNQSRSKYTVKKRTDVYSAQSHNSAPTRNDFDTQQLFTYEQKSIVKIGYGK